MKRETTANNKGLKCHESYAGAEFPSLARNSDSASAKG